MLANQRIDMYIQYRLSLIICLILAGFIILNSKVSNAEAFPKAQCPAKETDITFLPCGEKFLAPKTVGIKLVDYKGQDLPSDGPIIDLLSDKWSIKSKDGLLKTTFNFVSGTAENPMLAGSKPYKVITYSGPYRNYRINHNPLTRPTPYP